MTFKFLPLACCLFVLAACTPREQEAVDTNVEQATAELRDNTQQAISRFDAQINELEANIDNASEDARADMRETIAELRSKRDALQNDLDGLANATADNLDDARTRINRAEAELDESLFQARLDMAQTKDEFQAAAQARMDDLDRQIDEMEAKASNVSADARAQYDETVANLREERRQMGEKWDAFTNATEDNWQDLKGDIASGLTAFGRNVDNATDRMAADMRDGVDN